jgi:hypothetical protein
MFSCSYKSGYVVKIKYIFIKIIHDKCDLVLFIKI